MVHRVVDAPHGLLFDYPATADLLDTVDIVTDMALRVQHAAGMAQVCAAVVTDEHIEDRDVAHALAALHSYLTALHQGMALWRTRMLPAPPARKRRTPNDPRTPR